MKFTDRMQQRSGVTAFCNFGIQPVTRRVRSRNQTRIAAIWHVVTSRIIPFGYENESGFYFGIPAGPGNDVDYA
jgi:hypothetical protein